MKGKAEEELDNVKGKGQRKLRAMSTNIKVNESKQSWKPSIDRMSQERRKIWKLPIRKERNEVKEG